MDYLNRRGKASLRKARLFAAATCRLYWKRLPMAECRRLVEAVEEYVEDESSWADVLLARELANDTYDARFSRLPPTGNPNRLSLFQTTLRTSAQTLREVLGAYMSVCPEGENVMRWEDPQLCDVVRCVFWNPFKKVKFNEKWRTDTAVTLGRTMYDGREFGAMPILADALQDAGCDSDDVLNHCRAANAPHVRGCWVVDLVLGKQ